MVGAVVSTVKALLSATPALPALSTARTYAVCAPPASPVYCFGLVHVANAPLSRRHSNRATSDAGLEKKTLAVAVEPVTWTSLIDVLGAVVSTLNVSLSAAPTLPALSTARTETCASPSVSAVNCFGLVHVANAPLSTRHSNRATSDAALEKKTAVASSRSPGHR